MEKWIRRTIDFASGLTFTGKTDPSVIPYIPSKLKVSGHEEKYFPRTRPEDVGISSGRMIAFISALEEEKSAVVHNLLCIKDGKVILECSHPGYSVNTWHLSHSMSKVLVSIAVGFLIDEKALSLDQRIAPLFPEYEYRDKRFADITVRHLLTMTSCIRFGEAGVVSESEWTRAFFESSVTHTPGSRFDYNSMNTYILGRIVIKLTGRSLTDYLRERLLTPLRITNFFWELGPEGYEKGGFGVFMSAESWGKIGTLFLNKGIFEGKEIIPKWWIEESVQSHVAVPENLGNYNYGYKIWVSRSSHCYLFSGMLGQAVCIFPNSGIVVVMNSGNNELFQSGRALSIIESFFSRDLSSDVSSSQYHGSYTDLLAYSKHFFEKRHWIRVPKHVMDLSRFGFIYRRTPPREWDKLLGTFVFPTNNRGILPVFIRAMQNNFAGSIDKISFTKENNRIFFVCNDGMSKHRLEVGFYGFCETVIDVRGEKYIVKVMGEAAEDYERREAFKLEILLPEMPNTRKILFTLDGKDRLYMRLYEIPDSGLARVYTDEIIKTNNRFSPLIDLIERKMGENYLKRKITETFDITLLGAREGSPDFEDILDESRKSWHSDERNARIIDTLVYHFIRESEDGGKGGIVGFLGDAVDKLLTGEDG